MAPDKGSSDQAQGTEVVLCPDVLPPPLLPPLFREALTCITVGSS